MLFRSNTERAKKILADSGIEHPAFAQKLGIKANSFRMNLSMGRLSKKAVAMLLDLESDLKEDVDTEPSEAASLRIVLVSAIATMVFEAHGSHECKTIQRDSKRG